MFVIRIVAIAALAFACAPGNQVDTHTARNFPRDVLTAEEISSRFISRPSSSAYDVVSALRPEFLKSRGCQSATNGASPAPVVFVNGVKLSGSDALHRMRADDLFEVRYVRPIDAMTLYGQGNPCGVLVINTK